MAEFKIDGRMKVKKLKEDFFNEFGGVLRVYNGKSKADDDASLASIRANDAAKGGELLCRGNRSVKSFKQEMWDVFGIKVQVATKDDWIIVLDGITLSRIKDIPNYASKESMQEFVGNISKMAGKIRTSLQSTMASIKEARQEAIEKLTDNQQQETLTTEKNARQIESKEMSIEDILKELKTKWWELEEKCKEMNLHFTETLKKYLEETGKELYSLGMEWEEAKEYTIDTEGCNEEEVEEYIDSAVFYSEQTGLYYPKDDAMMNIFITSLLEDGYIPLEYKYVRCIAEFSLDKRFADKIIKVTRYFDDDGTEHESECEGFLLANPNIPASYNQIKSLIEHF